MGLRAMRLRIATSWSYTQPALRTYYVSMKSLLVSALLAHAWLRYGGFTIRQGVMGKEGFKLSGERRIHYLQVFGAIVSDTKILAITEVTCWCQYVAVFIADKFLLHS